MLLAVQIFCFASIALAVIVGVRASYVCAPRLEEFSIRELVRFFIDPKVDNHHAPFWSWIFVLNFMFTFMEALAFILRAGWLLDMGWDDIGARWALNWLSWHSLMAWLCIFFPRGS